MSNDMPFGLSVTTGWKGSWNAWHIQSRLYMFVGVLIPPEYSEMFDTQQKTAVVQ